MGQLTIEWVHQRIAGNGSGRSTHSCTKIRSVVAQKNPQFNSSENHTGSQGVMSIIDITTSHFLHDLICTEVDRVGGTYRRESELSLQLRAFHDIHTCADNHTRNSLP